MKIFIHLESAFFSKEENVFLMGNLIEFEWELPFLPRVNEFFEFEEIIDPEKIPSFCDGNLSWHVVAVNWTTINYCIVPVIWLEGN